MRKEIGSVLLILGIIVIILNTAYLIHEEEPGRFKGFYSYEGKAIIAYHLLAIGIGMTLLGVIISVRQKPDKKRFFMIPIEYFSKAIAGFTIARIFASGLLIWALAEHEYAYYTILRFVVFGITSYGTFLAIRFKKVGWAWIFGIVTILFNPFLPIHLEKSIWAITDTLTALLLVISIFLFGEAKSKLQNCQ